MSKQYQKQRTKKVAQSKKADSRYTVEEAIVKAVGTDEYVPEVGDSVVHKLHTMYGVGKVTSSILASSSASVYWPRNDHTTVQGFHVLREKSAKFALLDTINADNDFEEKPGTQRGQWYHLPPEQKEGLWVRHKYHSAFGVGAIMFQHQNAGGYVDMYRVKWRHGSVETERDHKSMILRLYEGEPENGESLPSPVAPNLFYENSHLHAFGDVVMRKADFPDGVTGIVIDNEKNGVIGVDWGDGVRMREVAGELRLVNSKINMSDVRTKEKPLKTTKDPNPNRGFRFHKRGKRSVYVPFNERSNPTETFVSRHKTETEQARCCSCHTVVEDNPKWVRTPDGTKLYCTGCFKGRLANASKKKMATVLQKLTIKDLSRRKGVKTAADLDSISYTAADIMISQWTGLPNIHIDPSESTAEPALMAKCAVCREPCSPFNSVTVNGTSFTICSSDCRRILTR